MSLSSGAGGGGYFTGFFGGGYGESRPADKCAFCGKVLSGTRVALQSRGKEVLCCYACAGFRFMGEVPPREQIIRETVPLESGVPLPVLADWLEEQGRSADAEYIRKRATQ